MDDLISRQAAIDYCEALMNAEREQQTDDWGYGRERYNQTEVIQHYLENMPSAQPERERGKWIRIHWKGFRCSRCNRMNEYFTNFCPECGADMRGEQNVYI